MTDIVERLRKVESSTQNMSNSVTTNWYRNPDGPEAADEIERLRARLAEAMKYVQHFTDCEWVDNGCRDKADHPCSCGFDRLLYGTTDEGKE